MKTNSSSSSTQESTISMRTINMQKLEQIEYETDINDQNILNKKNEKLIKPCKNGNCYCFTSDSDDFRNTKNKNLNRNQKIKHKPEVRKPENDVKRYHESCSKESDLESFTSSDSSECIKSITDLSSMSTPNQRFREEKCDFVQNHGLTANSKTFIYRKSKNGIPIIHIIQEFHNNSIVSEVRINNPQKKVRSENIESCKGKSFIKNKIELEKRGLFHKFENIEEIRSKDRRSDCRRRDESLVNKNKSNLRYSGGQLYQKRIGCETLQHYKDYKSPPKKPPRSASSSSEKFKSNCEVGTNIGRQQQFFDDFSTINTSELKNQKSDRKSFLLDNQSNIIDSQDNPLGNNVVSENEKLELGNKNLNFGWIHPDSEIVEMLESNKNISQLQSLHQKPESQIGWKIPAKLDIDTVDGFCESLPNDSHNFAKNMESKNTPVKNDFTTQTENSVKDQLKELISSSVKKGKKNSQNNNKLELNSSFREKSKIGAKIFLINSKQKLVEMVTGRSDKTTTKKNVAVQTSTNHFYDYINDNFLCNNSLYAINQNPSQFNLQSPDRNYLSKLNATNDFDFNRTVNSPKSVRSTQRKLSFSPKKLIRNFSYRPVCIDHPISDNDYYKSFDNHINKDFTLSSINNILLSIRTKLESSDNHAENTFREVYQRENNLKKSFEVKEEFKENENLKDLCSISAKAEVHNNPNPIYSEYEEEKLIITGSPSNRSLNDISHYYIDENPNAIYARVKKVPKQCNNIPENKRLSISPDVNNSEFLKRSEVYPNNTANNKDNDIEQNSQILYKSSMDDMTMLFGRDKEPEYESLNDISYYIHNMTPNTEPQGESNFQMDDDVVDGLSTNQTITSDNESDMHYKIKLDMQKSEKKSSKGSPIIYKNIKQKFRESFNKSKNYLKNETNLFSSFNKSKDIKIQNNFYHDKNTSTIWDESDLGIYDLYSECPPVSEQLKKTVSLCRKIPYFDSTLEAVEAERLLLYSTLKTEKVQNNSCAIIPHISVNCGKIYIDSFKLSVSSDVNRDIFFNYFYIAVFSYGLSIRSSNFAEKLENTIIFRNCNIIFDSVHQNSKIKCDIYMLRLRKILKVHSKIQDQLIAKMDNLDVSYESSGEEYLSRFKLQGCFEFDTRNFIPYTIEENCKYSELNNMMCLHANNSTTIPLILVARGTHLKNEISIQASLEILFPKFEIEGFLSIQDLENKHNWNRFWCKLDYFVLKIWNYPQDSLDKDVIYSFDLCKCLTFPVKVVDRSLCARLRSFFLTVLTNREDNCYKNVFFSADNHEHLNFWIDGLNRILEFINFWMNVEAQNIQLNN